MKHDLLGKLASRLKGLESGGYARGYRQGGKLRGTSTRQLLGSLFDSLKIPYQEDVPVPNAGSLTADFVVNGIWVFVDREVNKTALKRLGDKRRDWLFVRRDAFRSDGLDHGVRVLGLEEKSDLQTIFLDDPSFNFDYAHILPKTQKCSVMHGHTSSALVEVVGRPLDGMVVDFGIAKDIIRDTIRSLDHKLFINQKYITMLDSKNVTLRFKTVHGEFAIKAPRATTVLLSGEATVESLAREFLSRIAPKMPANVTAVGVYVYEGLNKGSHLLAQIHQGRVKRPRKRR